MFKFALLAGFEVLELYRELGEVQRWTRLDSGADPSPWDRVVTIFVFFKQLNFAEETWHSQEAPDFSKAS